MKKLLFILALFQTACATAVTKYTVSTEDEPYSYFENGVPFIVSQGEHARIVMGPAATAQDAEGRQLFFVEVTNRSDKAFNFGPDKLDIQTSNERPIAVLTPEKLQREAKRAANWLALSASLQQVSNNLATADAGNTYGSASYSSRTNYIGSGGYGTASTYGTASYSGYDGGAAAQAHFAAQRENREIDAHYSKRISELLRDAQDGALKYYTIRPRETISSLVLIEKIPGKSEQVRVRAKVAGEIHTMSWNYSVE